MARALNNRQILRAAGVMILGFMTSGLLGLLRQAIVNAIFGPSAAMDAFTAAQRIPELLFVLVAGGALGSSFLPIYVRKLNQNDAESAWRLASATLTLVLIIGTAVALLFVILAPFLMPIMIPNDPPEMQALATSLTQIMLITVALFGVSGVAMALLNAHQSFLLPALAPSMYNVGLIIGAALLAPLLSVDGQPNIYGLAWGAVLGALLHLGVQIPGIRRIGARLQLLPDPRIAGVRDVLLLMLPRLLAQGIAQVNFIVNVAFTSGMVEGSRTVLTNAWTLMFTVLGVIGQSIGAAVFPSLAALGTAGDLDGFKDRLAGALRGVLFLSFPAAVGLIILGQPIVALLFERGQWTAEDSAGTAWALAFYALGIPGFALLEVLSRAFYALEDTRTPVIAASVSLICNIILSFVLIRVMGDPASLARGPFAGLALANAVTTLLEGLALWGLLRRKIGGGKDRYVVDGALRALGAASGMGVVVWGVQEIARSLNNSVITTVIGASVGAIAFFGLALLLRIEEARTIPDLILKRLRR